MGRRLVALGLLGLGAIVTATGVRARCSVNKLLDIDTYRGGDAA